MKIRNGFVSNSSSSSFIISNEKFPTLRNLAKFMIKKRGNEDDKELIEKLKNIDENQSVSFNSYGDTTFIDKADDCYLVSTCNNIDWNLYGYMTRLSENAKDYLINKLNDYSPGSDEYDMIERVLDGEREFYSFGNNYYNLEKEVIGLETWDHCNNKSCDCHMWDTTKFGKICLVCNPILKRKEKLEKINNIYTEEE